MVVQDPLNECFAAAARHSQVGDDCVKRIGFERLGGELSADGFGHLMSGGFQNAPAELAQRRFVVDYENLCGVHDWSLVYPQSVPENLTGR